MKLMDKIMEKKSGKSMDPMYKDAKMSMLQELRDSMSGMMKDDLNNAKGMKKVTVAGNSPEAVSEGLEKAKEMVAPESPEGENPESMLSDMMGHESAEGELTPEKCDMLIQMLQKKKEEMSAPSKPEATPSKFGF